MHALLWVNRLFPGHFKNVIFLAVGEVDAQRYEGAEHLDRLRHTISASLAYYVAHCRRHGMAADYRIAECTRLAETTMDTFPDSVCFASKLIFKHVNFLTAWVHNQTPLEIKTRRHVQGKQMVLLPMMGVAGKRPARVGLERPLRASSAPLRRPHLRQLSFRIRRRRSADLNLDRPPM